MNVTSIGDGAFYNCPSLTNFYFNPTSNLTSIGNNTFAHCSSLQSVTLPALLQTIGAHAFSVSGLISVTLPALFQSIGIFAFYNYQVMSIQRTSLILEELIAKSLHPSKIEYWLSNGVDINDLHELYIYIYIYIICHFLKNKRF